MLGADDASGLPAGWFLENLWLAALIPGIGFALIILIGKRMPMKGSGLGLASMAASLVVATGAGYQWVQRVDAADGHTEEGAFGLIRGFARSLVPQASEGGHAEPFVEPVTTTWVWWQSGGLEFSIGSQADGLSVLILWLVAFISLLVQVFSLDYVRGDRRYTHFFGSLTLFSAGMLVMVMAPNMVQFILGWEIMGLCSFLLIGHWWEEDANSIAALKAFWTVRVGDVGLLVGTAILFFAVNAWAQDNLGLTGFDIVAIQGWALSGEGSSQVILWAAVALFIACIGKSGQFPLHTWLPDAMAGPTPVSSLLHSSTMVVAGVFLVARLYPVFWTGFNIGTGGLSFVAIIGGITIIIAALLAFVQDDIKKVLAYSTVSQLGYMMLGLGTGAWLPAVFHIFTHAFFKCCLFLCAGSVSHSGSHHSFDMKKDMGGLRKKMPVTFASWIVSTLALTGVFPFAGFWSKDEIIDNVGHAGYDFLFWVGLGGAILTAAYMTRATYLTFFGEPRGAAAGEHHEDEEHAEEHEMETLTVGARSMGETADELAVDRSALVGGGGSEGSAGDELHGGVDRSGAAGGDDHEEGSAGDESHGGSGQSRAEASADHHDDGDHGDHGDHAHDGPHESGPLILVPIVILAFLALTAGFLNATPLGESFERMKTYVEPRPEAVAIDELHATGPGEMVVQVGALAPSADEEGGEKTGCGFEAPESGSVCFFPAVSHAEPQFAKILLSLGVVAAGYAGAIAFCVLYYGRREKRLVGLTDRSRPLRGGYLFLKNKYYLDYLYENVIVHAFAYPIARACNWFNQVIIDGVVNSAGRGARKTGDWVYDNVDQTVVDGAVNASGTVASEAGHGLQPTQSGKVNQYGALLFGAATVGAIVLVIVNVN
jgi:NADH-quinone oxidoreductase subunit L